MEKKSSFFIFLIIIAILTLIIAALVSFIMLVGINASNSAPNGGESSATVSVEPPDESLLANLVLLESARPINLRTDDPTRPSFALVEMSIKYFKQVDGIKDVQAKITLNTANLQEIVTTYFMAMGVDEFSKFETKARAKEELKKELNEYLLMTISSEKDRKKVDEVIYDVVFSAWNYQ